MDSGDRSDPQAYCGSAASNQNFAGFRGGTLSPILTGFVVDTTGSFVLALGISAAVTLIGAALFQFTMTTVIDETELENTLIRRLDRIGSIAIVESARERAFCTNRGSSFPSRCLAVGTYRRDRREGIFHTVLVPVCRRQALSSSTTRRLRRRERIEMNAIATKAMRCSFERSKMVFNRR